MKLEFRDYVKLADFHDFSMLKMPIITSYKCLIYYDKLLLLRKL